MRALRAWIDPFIVAILVALAVGILVPVPAGVRQAVEVAGDVAVVLLFLVYGMRLATREVIDGVRNVRLQLAILAATYVLFPALGLALHTLTPPLIGEEFATGLLYLSLLPSTVQSSVTFVSIARGNIAGAITAATISNVLGMIITPLLVLGVLGAAGETGGGGKILLQLLVPFVVGQLLQPWLGGWVRARRWLTVSVDRGTIVLVVLGAAMTATADGVWEEVGWLEVLSLIGLSAVLLGVMLALTWWGGRLIGLDVGDRIALLMCGSKKSLATGLPMAKVLFPAATAATVAVPVIVFHQFQLIVAAVLARRLARRAG